MEGRALEERLAATVTALQLLGATAKDYDAHTQAKGVLEKRLYGGREGTRVGCAACWRACRPVCGRSTTPGAGAEAYVRAGTGCRNKEVIGNLNEVDRIAQGIDIAVPVELLA